ncbi:MAG: hypothetical protein NUV51_03540 [Sulfuricaulis sp.]|nr:hypothetical protein [Sulfuricaulis sp.]
MANELTREPATYLRALFDKTAAAHEGLDYPERINAALIAVYDYGRRRSVGSADACELIAQLEGALANSEGCDFQIRADFVREIIAALQPSEPIDSGAEFAANIAEGLAHDPQAVLEGMAQVQATLAGRQPSEPAAIALLREWRATELDAQDEEYQPWMDSFTARVDAVLQPSEALPEEPTGAMLGLIAGEYQDSPFMSRDQALIIYRAVRALARAAAPQRAGQPKVVCLSGSSRFVAEMAYIAWALERDEGYITLGLHLLPADYPGVTADHMAETEGRKEHFDNLHLRKIDLSHEVLVVNIGGYIGESTRNEIAYAKRHGKPVRYLEPPAPDAKEQGDE